MSEQISLTDTPRALRAHGIKCSYLRIWRGVVAGDLPAERLGNRWMVRAADLPMIAQFLTDKV